MASRSATPEHDQNAVIDLVREDWVDTVQLIYNVFSQAAQEGLLAETSKHGVGVSVRVPMDESSLPGKSTATTRFFAEADMRSSYFAGDRLPRTVQRVDSEPDKARLL